VKNNSPKLTDRYGLFDMFGHYGPYYSTEGVVDEGGQLTVTGVQIIGPDPMAILEQEKDIALNRAIVKSAANALGSAGVAILGYIFRAEVFDPLIQNPFNTRPADAAEIPAKQCP